MNRAPATRGEWSWNGTRGANGENIVNIGDCNSDRNNFGAGGAANAALEPSNMVLVGNELVDLLAARRFGRWGVAVTCASPGDGWADLLPPGVVFPAAFSYCRLCPCELHDRYV